MGGKSIVMLCTFLYEKVLVTIFKFFLWKCTYWFITFSKGKATVLKEKETICKFLAKGRHKEKVLWKKVYKLNTNEKKEKGNGTIH